MTKVLLVFWPNICAKIIAMTHLSTYFWSMGMFFFWFGTQLLIYFEDLMIYCPGYIIDNSARKQVGPVDGKVLIEMAQGRLFFNAACLMFSV